jgi:hypothetical protein
MARRLREKLDIKREDHRLETDDYASRLKKANDENKQLRDENDRMKKRLNAVCELVSQPEELTSCLSWYDESGTQLSSMGVSLPYGFKKDPTE